MSGPLGIASGGGAPKTGAYVVVGAVPAALTQGRQLTGSANEIVITDSGAGNAVTLTVGSLIVQTDQANTWTTGAQTINTGAIGNQALILKMAAGQTENGFEYQSSAGGVLLSVAASGEINVSSNQGMSCPTAGAIIMSEGANRMLRLTRTNVGFIDNVRSSFFQFGQSYAFFTANNGALLARFGITANGTILSPTVFGSLPVPAGLLHLANVTTTVIPLVVQAAAGQTAARTQWQDSTGAVNLSVATAGATGYNEGTITVSNNADTVVLDQMVPQANESHFAGYTVPAGYKAFIVSARATEASSKGSEFGLWVRPFGGLWHLEQSIVLLDSVLVVSFPIPILLPEKADLEMRAKAVLAGAIVTAGFDGWIET